MSTKVLGTSDSHARSQLASPAHAERSWHRWVPAMLCCWVAITLRVFLRLGSKVEWSTKHSTSALLAS